MKKIIVTIVIGAFLFFSFIAPNLVAEADKANGDKTVIAETEDSLQISIPTTLLFLSTGLVGLIAVTRKNRPNRK